jgi:hypothetical protein
VEITVGSRELPRTTKKRPMTRDKNNNNNVIIIIIIIIIGP